MSKDIFSIHIDVDSPLTLAKFYNIEIETYNLDKLERFYEVTFDRIIEILEPYNIKATFFCVASEIESSEKIKQVIKNAIARGHFIGHHTLNHPFGLNEMNNEEMMNEIIGANEIFKKTIGFVPKGFRTPGYAVDTNVINKLEENGIQYDSSAAWPIFHVLFKIIRLVKKNGSMLVGYGETNSRFRSKPYSPSIKNWKSRSKEKRGFMEYPLPASFGLIPCYGNLHLYFSHSLIEFLLKFTKRYNHLIYLFHNIEFSSLEDDFIPQEIAVHPHVSRTLEVKSNKVKCVLNYLNKNRSQYIIEENN
jgi:hypothetical protein